MMTSPPPRDVPGAAADEGTTAPAAGRRPGQRLIAVMLLAAAALDLARCGIVLVTARQAGPAIGLVVRDYTSSRPRRLNRWLMLCVLVGAVVSLVRMRGVRGMWVSADAAAW